MDQEEVQVWLWKFKVWWILLQVICKQGPGKFRELIQSELQRVLLYMWSPLSWSRCWRTSGDDSMLHLWGLVSREPSWSWIYRRGWAVPITTCRYTILHSLRYVLYSFSQCGIACILDVQSLFTYSNGFWRCLRWLIILKVSIIAKTWFVEVLCRIGADVTHMALKLSLGPKSVRSTY